MVNTIINLPRPSIWVNGFIKEELEKYSDTFSNIIVVPTTPTAIDDIYKNTTGDYPDIAIQYDILFRMQRNTFYGIKAEQLLYYIYSTKTEKILDAQVIIDQLLNRSDASAQELNAWMAEKQEGSSPIYQNPPTNTLKLIPNVYFHNTKVYQLEETRDLAELGSIRGITLNKMIVEYEYHYGAPNNPYT
jgi:hypothetical protein